MAELDLLKTFELELRASAEQIQASLLSVETAAAAEAARALHEAYRLTHSVKGASRVVGLAAIEDMAHALEDRLQGLVRESTRPSTAMTTAFLKVVDGFSAGLAAFQGGAEFDPEPFMRELRRARRRQPRAPGARLDGPAERGGGSGGDPAADAAAEAPATWSAASSARDEFLRVPTAAWTSCSGASRRRS